MIIPAILTVLALIWLTGRSYLGADRLSAYEQRLREIVDAYPFGALIVTLLVYTVVSLVPGTTGKSLVMGWLFGFWMGLVIVSVALTIAATLAFLGSRYLFQGAVRAWLHSGLDRIDEALERDGPFHLITLRLIHAPYTVVNYSFGPTRVAVRTFVWTTLLGLLPSNALFVYAGTRLPTLNELAHQKAWALADGGLMGALLILAITPFAVRAVLRRVWPRVEQDADQPLAQPR